MTAVMRQVGTGDSCDSEMLKMSVKTPPSWLWHVFSIRPGILSRPAFLYLLSAGFFSYAWGCGYWQCPVLWRQSRFHSWTFVEVRIKCIQLVRQCGLTHDVGTQFWMSCLMSLVLLVLRSLSSLCRCLFFASVMTTFSFALVVGSRYGILCGVVCFFFVTWVKGCG